LCRGNVHGSGSHNLKRPSRLSKLTVFSRDAVECGQSLHAPLN
jgi:hypothetical protein